MMRLAATMLAAVLAVLSAAEAFAESAAPVDMEAVRKAYARPTATPFPADNPYSTEKYQLGWMLFFDPRLSGAGNISCATCHNPALSWGDGIAKGIGHAPLPRRTPTVANLAWADRLMWDGRKISLEDQVFGPITTEAEMNMAGGAENLVGRLSAIPEYRVRFVAAFPGEGISQQTISKAIATYERTIVSGVAPFDRWLAGDDSALSASAKRGFALFNGRANCSLCHEGWSFTDHAFHDIGLPDVDVGRAKYLNLPSMQHAFKTPTLRDIGRRSPYMHDGSIKTLRDVVLHYDHLFVQRPSLATEVHRLDLTKADVDDLVAFLETLTGEQTPVNLPLLPAAAH